MLSSVTTAAARLWWLCLAPLFVISLYGGPLVRTANTTLAMPLDPPTHGFTATNAFGGLVFTNPICITSPPGETNRLFVVERNGLVVVITNLAAPTRTIFLDIRSKVSSAPDTQYADEKGLLSLVFHPDYASNRHFYVWYTAPNSAVFNDVLARYQTTPTNSNLALAASEQRLIVQYDEQANHNGGDLHFGPQDGYLYLSTGDEGAQQGTMGNTQRIDRDFFSSLLRIDVDKRPGNLAPNPHPAIVTNGSGQAYYSIPLDNPFVHTSLGGDWNGTFNGSLIGNLALVRSEFWAVGLRNPFRFSFDDQTGLLYLGDVGEQDREEINLIERGANYGWNWFEGSLQRSNSFPAGPVPTNGFTHALPWFEYIQPVPAQKWAIVGGRVYRGTRLSQLTGAYLYAEYGQGFVWALKHVGTNIFENVELLREPYNKGGIAAVITTFGVDPSNGDILYALGRDGTNGNIRRLMYSTNVTGTPLPPTLADTGAFSNVASLDPAPGVVPYAINVPFWSDNAIKTRWFSVPNTNLTLGFDPMGNWSFPTGSVWIKHFELELTNGLPGSRQRLETRLLVRNSAGIHGATYRWGASLTNATLVPEEGMDESFVIHDGGVIRTQVWHYPARAECQQCHSAQGGLALGFNTPQLHCDTDYGGMVTNQLRAFEEAGYFSAPLGPVQPLRALAHATNSAVSLEYRVRSYLAANCRQCHQGYGSALFDANISTTTAAAGLIDGALYDNLGNTNNRVIHPASLDLSVLYQRTANLGGNHMPPLATTLIDTQNVALVAAWITNDLPAYQAFADWRAAQAWALPEDGDALADPDHDGAVNRLEWLTKTDPLLASDYWNMGIQRSGAHVQILIPLIANRAFQVQYTDQPDAGSVWTPLDVPENRPIFPASSYPHMVTDPTSSEGIRLYRVLVYEP